MPVKRIGIIVGGGPAPGTNGVISAVAIEAIKVGCVPIGFHDGFDWLAQRYTDEQHELTIEEVSRIHLDGGVFLGTDATERWEAPAFRAYAHPHFARGKAWSFRAARRAVTVRGDLAWFDEDLETQNLGPARGSGVLSLRDGKWLIEQYVLSITVPNARFRAVRDLLAAP